MAEFDIELWFLHCAGRDQVFADTVQSLNDSDWPIDRVHTLLDSDATNELEKNLRLARAVEHLFSLFLKGDADYLLYCENDIEFNQHIHHNILSWLPFKQELNAALLYIPDYGKDCIEPYCSGVKMLETHSDYSIANPQAVWGAQAVLLSRKAVEYLHSNWRADFLGTLVQDLRIIHLVTRAGWPIYVHSPNLVEHRPTPSLWGGLPHKSVDFSPDFCRSVNA